VGASLGGPLWKDHTFWFTNFEKQKFNIATGDTGYEPNQYYQAAATALLKAANVPLNSATSQLIAILWPANLLTGTSAGGIQNAAPEFGYSYNGVMKVDHTFNDKQASTGARSLDKATRPPGGHDGHQPLLLRDRPHPCLQLLGGLQLVHPAFAQQHVDRRRELFSPDILRRQDRLQRRCDGGIRDWFSVCQRAEYQHRV